MNAQTEFNDYSFVPSREEQRFVIKDVCFSDSYTKQTMLKGKDLELELYSMKV